MNRFTKEIFDGLVDAILQERRNTKVEWTKFTHKLPDERRAILVAYKQDMFVMRLESVDQLSVHGKQIKHYYLDSLLHGGWWTSRNGKRLAMHPDLLWRYPSEFVEEQPVIESNVISVTVDEDEDEDN